MQCLYKQKRSAHTGIKMLLRHFPNQAILQVQSWTENSLKNSVFVLILVFLSDFLFLMLQGHAWRSQTSEHPCGKYLI